MSKIVVISKCCQCPYLRDSGNPYNIRYECALTQETIHTEDAVDLIHNNCPLPDSKTEEQ